MAKRNQNVTFRRVGGRVIPIHVKEGLSDISKGSAIALGTGVVAGLTLKAPALGDKIAKTYFKSRVGTNTSGKIARAVFRKASNIKAVGNSLPALAAPVFVGGLAFGSSIVSRGIQRTRNEKRPSLGTLIAQNAGDVAVFGLSGTGFLRGAGYSTKRSMKGMASLVPDYLQRFKPQAWSDFASILNRMGKF